MTLRDLLFLGPFFIISFLALRPTVTAFDNTWIAFWAFLGALCMTAVAWLAQQMFKVILIDEKSRNRAGQRNSR